MWAWLSVFICCRKAVLAYSVILKLKGLRCISSFLATVNLKTILLLVTRGSWKTISAAMTCQVRTLILKCLYAAYTGSNKSLSRLAGAFFPWKHHKAYNLRALPRNCQKLHLLWLSNRSWRGRNCSACISSQTKKRLLSCLKVSKQNILSTNERDYNTHTNTKHMYNQACWYISQAVTKLRIHWYLVLRQVTSSSTTYACIYYWIETIRLTYDVSVMHTGSAMDSWCMFEIFRLFNPPGSTVLIRARAPVQTPNKLLFRATT